jgi:hypothetical protein
MEQELIDVLNNIQEAIKNNDIRGYKNLLYLIYQNNEMDGNEEIKQTINNFIHILFSEKIIVENSEQQPQQQQECCLDKGATYGKEKPYSKEPIDIQVAKQFVDILPTTIYPSLNESIRRRFELH